MAVASEFELDFSKHLSKTEDLSDPELIMLYGPYGQGKGLIYGTSVETPTGPLAVEKLAIGDEVIGSDGKPVQVYGIWDRGVLPVFEVILSDGSSVTVDGEHLWTVSVKGRTQTLETNEIATRLSTKDARSLSVPIVQPVQYVGSDLPIPPYALGALLSDGYLHGAAIQWTKNDQAVADEMNNSLATKGWFLRENTRESGTARQWKINHPDDKSNQSVIRPAVQTLNLDVSSREKFIPQAYRLASVADRWELLYGLFDGDGSVRTDRNNRPSYTSTSKQLSDDVLQLLWSLGVSAQQTSKSAADETWAVTVLSDHQVFKACDHADKVRVITRSHHRRRIVSVTPAGEAPVRCIAVKSADQLYVTKDYIVTHNTHLGLSASEVEGLYPMLVIDNEGSTSGVLQNFDQSRIDVIRPKDKWPGQEWQAINTLLNDLLSKTHKYKTVMIDPLNTMLEWAKEAGNKPGDGFAKWNFVHENLTAHKGLIPRLKDAKFLVILIVHEKKEGGEDDGPSFAEFRWQGQGTALLGQYPDMIGYVTRDTNAAGVSTSTLSTAPNKRSNAKNRFGLPAKMVNPSMQAIYDHISQTKEN